MLTTTSSTLMDGGSAISKSAGKHNNHRKGTTVTRTSHTSRPAASGRLQKLILALTVRSSLGRAFIHPATAWRSA